MPNKKYCTVQKVISDSKKSHFTTPLLPVQSFSDEERFCMNVLDALNSNIALINYDGLILKVNKAWRVFGSNNGAIGNSTLEGTNYFDTCKSSSTDFNYSGLRALKGIKDVINGITEEFYQEYMCNSPFEERWFYMKVKKIEGTPNVLLIEHNNISDRKITQKKLNETTDVLVQTVTHHNEVLDSSLDLICTVNENGNFVHINSASAKILGYEPKELIGVNFLDLVYVEDNERARKGFKEIKRGLNVIFFENRNYHKNGSIVHLFWSAKWDNKNKIVNCIARNQTYKKNLEKEILTEKQRFNALYLQAPCCMGILKGPNHVFEMANPLYLKLIAKENIIGLSVKEVLPEFEAQGIFCILDHVYRTGITYSANEKLIKFDFNGDGNLVDNYLNFIYQAHRNCEGEIDGILFFAIDVTEQVLSRTRVEQSEKKYRQIVETAQEGIWMIDENNKTTFVNSKMAEILEYSPQEMIGKEIFFFMDAHGKSKAVELLKKKKENYFTQFIFKFISKSGNEIWNNISSNPLFNEDNSYKGALGMVTDITERRKNEMIVKQQNVELVKAHSELDRFVYSVSHDLRSPLTSMLGLLSFIEEESQEEDTLQHVKMIHTSINRLDEFIKNILNYSRNNRIQLLIEKISVDGTIASIVDSLRNIPKAHGIDFSVESNQTIPFYTDAMRLNTILENLISNAIKHHKVEGFDRFIKIKTQFENNKLQITIADNGVGIESEFHEKIFEMFYRVSGDTDGTGIGLYIVKDAVEKIQGTIEIQSEKGKGTIFIIILNNLKL